MDYEQVVFTLTWLDPSLDWDYPGPDYDSLVWRCQAVDEPTWDDITDAWENGVGSAWSEGVHERARQARSDAYKSEADPLFFQWQREEGTEQAWLDAVAAVRDRYPYPVV